MDAARLKQSFAQVAQLGDAVPTFFYSYLFIRAPELMNLFPPSMSTQRDKLVTALGAIVSNVDAGERLTAFVRALGRDHRKFEVRTEHYLPVGEALLATLAHHLGDQWTDELAADWKTAYEIVSAAMIAAAREEEEAGTPSWWDAPVVAHERRPGTNIAVITVQPNRVLEYLPGQSIGVQFLRRPRIWRHYSPACAPRRNNMIDLHVRAVPGGLLSPALVFELTVGDELRLGQPTGRALTLQTADPNRDILLLAGGTGLAPLRALVEQLACTDPSPGQRQRQVILIHGGRGTEDLYDMTALTALKRGRPWFNIVSVVSDDPHYPGDHGTPIEVALRAGQWSEHEVFVCGPPEMVIESRRQLVASGLPPEQLHIEEFDPHGYIPSTRPTAAIAAEASVQ